MGQVAGPELLSQELPLREWKLGGAGQGQGPVRGDRCVARPELALGAAKDC